MLISCLVCDIFTEHAPMRHNAMRCTICGCICEDNTAMPKVGVGPYNAAHYAVEAPRFVCPDKIVEDKDEPEDTWR